MDGLDNNKNGFIDELDEDCLMNHFMFYKNINGIATGNMAVTDDYYDYLNGHWLDGQAVTYGGDGRGSGNGSTTNPCNYMFSGTSNPINTFNWTMTNAGTVPDDMRFLISDGKLSFAPGGFEYLTNAVIWQQAASGGPQASLALLKSTSLQVQDFYDNCFTVTAIFPVAIPLIFL